LTRSNETSPSKTASEKSTFPFSCVGTPHGVPNVANCSNLAPLALTPPSTLVPLRFTGPRKTTSSAMNAPSSSHFVHDTAASTVRSGRRSSVPRMRTFRASSGLPARSRDDRLRVHRLRLACRRLRAAREDGAHERRSGDRLRQLYARRFRTSIP
jgi:hypothetical protein